MKFNKKVLGAVLTSVWLAGCTGTSSSDNREIAKTCPLPSEFQWEASSALVSPNEGIFGIKDPSVVYYEDKYHIWATINDGNWKSVYFSFADWQNASKAVQQPMNGTKVGNTVAPQVFYYRPHDKWYNFTQWGRGYSTTSNITDVNSWTARKDFLQDGPPIEQGKPELDYWVICDDGPAGAFERKPTVLTPRPSA